MTQSYSADVCIIGSGVAGAITATRCLAAGLDVVMIEAGTAWRRPWPVALAERHLGSHRLRMRLWLRNARYESEHHIAEGDRPYRLPGAAVLARGGSTLAWSGYAYRLKPEDFRLQTLTGQGKDWPISYSDLEISYRRAEQTLGASGDGTDPGHPPRSGPFPVAPKPYAPRDRLFEEIVADESVMHHNATLTSDGIAFSADAMIAKAGSSPGFTLLEQTTAQRLVIEDPDRFVAVDCSTLSGDRVTVEAAAAIVCAGGIESPKLLLASRSGTHPHGLGNAGGHLGRNLISHTGLRIGGAWDSSDPDNDAFRVTAASRGPDVESGQSKGKYLLLWRPIGRSRLILNAVIEQLPQHENSVELREGRDRFGLSNTRTVFSHDESHRRRMHEVAQDLRDACERAGVEITIDDSYVHAHPMCTTRMSEDPLDGVVDSDLRVHGLDNVYVCGSSSFTTGGAAHPTITVAALAHRLSDLLIAQNLTRG